MDTLGLSREYKKLGTRRVPCRRVPHFLKEWSKGVFRLLGQKRLQPDDDKAMAYFRKRSEVGNFSGFTDSGRDWYLEVLDLSLALGRAVAVDSANILDIGCGRGGLLRWLQRRAGPNLLYTGVDQDPLAIALCNNHFGKIGRFECSDIRSLPPPPKPYDVIFAINVFPYCMSAISLLENISRQSHAKSLLIVVDPSRSLFWEREFGGFGISLRSRRTFMKIFESSPWSVHESGTFSLASCFSRPFFSVSNLFVLTPKQVH